MTHLIDVIALSKNSCQSPIHGHLAYATDDNIVGRPIAGYHERAAHLCLLTPKAAQALCEVQNWLIQQHRLGLYIYDAYRPKRAVMDFLHWSKQPLQPHEYAIKQNYYPRIDKEQLFPLGYFAEDSSHCYGNTVDLVLMDLATKTKLNMGTIFDFMDETSYCAAPPTLIGEEAYHARHLLREAMLAFQFEPYENEYWHFSHQGVAGREITTSLDIEITAFLSSKNE